MKFIIPAFTRRLVILAVVFVFLVLSSGSAIHAQEAATTVQTISGRLRGGDSAYDTMPVLVGLTDVVIGLSWRAEHYIQVRRPAGVNRLSVMRRRLRLRKGG